MTTQVKTFIHTAVAVTALAFAGIATAQDEVSKADKEFIKNAAELGRTEVEMGRIGQEKATDPQLKKLSAELIKDHTKGQGELKELAKKKGVEVEGEPTSAQKKMLLRLREKSGEEFDKEFREHAVKDHEKGIKMMQDAAEDTKDPDIKAFATKQIPIMQEHLAMASGKGDAPATDRGERKEGTTKAPEKAATTKPGRAE